jgi:hypothetical protein
VWQVTTSEQEQAAREAQRREFERVIREAREKTKAREKWRALHTCPHCKQCPPLPPWLQ